MGSIFDFFSSGTKEVEVNNIRYRIGFTPSDDDTPIRLDITSIPAVKQALDTLANDIAQLPIYYFQMTDAGRIRQRDGLGYQLGQQPNQNQNAFQFWHIVTTQMELGECFIRCRDLVILPFGYTHRYTDLNGNYRYAVEYTPDEKQKLGLDESKMIMKEDYSYAEVIHLFTSHDEDGQPLPLRQRFLATFGLGSDIYSYTCNVYNRGGVITGFLSTDNPVNDEQKIGIIKGFKKLFRSSRTTNGVDSDLKLAALDNGWKWNQINLTPQELMLLETKVDFEKDVAKIFGLPLWKMGILADYKYATAEAAARDYLQFSLNPRLSNIERELNSKLISPIDRNYFYIEFAREKIIQIDTQTKADISQKYIQSGVMSIDEARAGLNLDKVDGGGLRQVPVNVQSAAYTSQAEQLKLAKMQLEIDTLKKALETPAPQPPPPADPTPQPAQQSDKGQGLTPAPSVSNASQSFLEQMRAMQSAWLAQYGDSIAYWTAKDITALMGELGAMHGVNLDDFAAAYADSFTKRTATAKEINAAYEINRIINAGNFEACRRLYGSTCPMLWTGGKFDGQTKTLGENWAGNLKHPPIDPGDVESFLIKGA